MQHPFEIADCHLHMWDNTVNTYPWLEKTDQVIELMIGDYSSLPKKYVVEDYLKDTKGFNVTRTVMSEIVSLDPVKEVEWAQSLADEHGHPHGIIALYNPLTSNGDELLDRYSDLPNVKSVRAHLAWHSTNPLLRSAEHPNILMQREWRKHFAALNHHDFSWEFEIYSNQIPEAADLAKNFPNIKMMLHVMGWPEDITEEGRRVWKKHMQELAKCENVAVKIVSMGVIFPRFTFEEIKRWVRDAIEIFGADRAMFGSHMPLEKVAPRNFSQLYLGYMEMVADLSPSEKKKLFHDTAVKWYRLE